jgi:hypothetical protein
MKPGTSLVCVVGLILAGPFVGASLGFGPPTASNGSVYLLTVAAQAVAYIVCWTAIAVRSSPSRLSSTNDFTRLKATRITAAFLAIISFACVSIYMQNYQSLTAAHPKLGIRFVKGQQYTKTASDVREALKRNGMEYDDAKLVEKIGITSEGELDPEQISRRIWSDAHTIRGRTNTLIWLWIVTFASISLLYAYALRVLPTRSSVVTSQVERFDEAVGSNTSNEEPVQVSTVADPRPCAPPGAAAPYRDREQAMELNGDQSNRLADALNSAFPAELKRMDRVVKLAGFDISFADFLAGIGTTYPQALDALVTWAKSRNRVEDLLRAAAHENPGNRKLQAIYNELLSGSTSSPEPGNELDRVGD